MVGRERRAGQYGGVGDSSGAVVARFPMLTHRSMEQTGKSYLSVVSVDVHRRETHLHLALLFEDVAHATRSVDQSWFVFSFELGTQVSNIDFQDIGGAFKIQSPDTVQDDFTSEYLAWTFHEK